MSLCNRQHCVSHEIYHTDGRPVLFTIDMYLCVRAHILRHWWLNITAPLFHPRSSRRDWAPVYLKGHKEGVGWGGCAKAAGERGRRRSRQPASDTNSQLAARLQHAAEYTYLYH